MSNFSDSDNLYTPYLERPETYIVPALFFVVFTVGVIGNGTLVMVFVNHRAMRNVPNIYIFSLALADLLVLITCVPFTSMVYTMEYWPWGEVVCKISEYAKDIGVGVSVFTLTALSAERYFAIVKPLRRPQTKLMTVLSAILIWILAMGCALPNAIFARVKYESISESNMTITVCFPFPDIPGYPKYSVIIKSLIYYIVPLIIISLFYILIAIRLHSSANKMPGESQSIQGIAQANARKHVARMVLVFVFLFFICFLPYYVWILWFHLDPNAEDDFNDWWAAIKIVGFCLSFLNSCVNPIALYCVSGVFRAHFNRYLFCHKPKWPQNAFQSSQCEASSTIRRHGQQRSSITIKGSKKEGSRLSASSEANPVPSTLEISHNKEQNI